MTGWVGTVRGRANKATNAVARRAERMRLLNAVLWAVIAGLGVAFVAQWYLKRIIHTNSAAAAAPIDITRVALTIVGGVGGVVALVIAYRRQRDLEQGRFVERFGAAAAQLGASDVAVRIAGVYAMAGAADESDGLQRQQCIDVLCGYLRLPYTPELGGNHQTKLVLKHHRAVADGTRADDEERHLEYRHNDKEVRQTIVRVIADRTRPTAEYSWSSSEFRTAYLEDVDFSDGVFGGAARFGNATFAGDAMFVDATFVQIAQFEGVTFGGAAMFDGATFGGSTAFDGVAFMDEARFTNASFTDRVGFATATFSSTAQFADAVFSGPAHFAQVEFSGRAQFVNAKFRQPLVFSGTTFSDTTWFSDTTFSSDALFDRTTFAADAAFAGASFLGDTSFHAAQFAGNARFGSTGYAGAATFALVTFSGAAIFNGARFARRTVFQEATFLGNTRFQDVDFRGDAVFRRTVFCGIAVFVGAYFAGDTDFEGATFADAVDFRGIDFGGDRVTFAGPAQWGPPAPRFDWDPDPTAMPVNVEPQDWPPPVSSTGPNELDPSS
ncbi:pentapeptide repeat-containing protein [Nocardia sp. CA-128927]|uniref:pentapeptide repeat-containing protein n=1 Tax=Nocardia sp. CA-128927 TaxID=3239975 RepID=UPI003D99B66B